jgi:type II secretory pathway pseudopilin PulG
MRIGYLGASPKKTHSPHKMKNNLPPKVVIRNGMTLLEITVTISILLSMIAILMVATRTWKRGGDRSGCILNLRNFQMSMRCYQNLYGYTYGSQPNAENGTQNIADHLYEKGYISDRLHAQANGLKTCPAGGTYTASSPTTFPSMGTLFLKCSLAEQENHKPNPAKTAEW